MILCVKNPEQETHRSQYNEICRILIKSETTVPTETNYSWFAWFQTTKVVVSVVGAESEQSWTIGYTSRLVSRLANFIIVRKVFNPNAEDKRSRWLLDLAKPVHEHSWVAQWHAFLITIIIVTMMRMRSSCNLREWCAPNNGGKISLERTPIRMPHFHFFDFYSLLCDNIHSSVSSIRIAFISLRPGNHSFRSMLILVVIPVVWFML